MGCQSGQKAKYSIKTKNICQFWIVHIFSQFELCTVSLSLCMQLNWENMCTTQTERKYAQFKIDIYFLSLYCIWLFVHFDTPYWWMQSLYISRSYKDLWWFINCVWKVEKIHDWSWVAAAIQFTLHSQRNGQLNF